MIEMQHKSMARYCTPVQICILETHETNIQCKVTRDQSIRSSFVLVQDIIRRLILICDSCCIC